MSHESTAFAIYYESHVYLRLFLKVRLNHIFPKWLFNNLYPFVFTGNSLFALPFASTLESLIFIDLKIYYLNWYLFKIEENVPEPAEGSV